MTQFAARQEPVQAQRVVVHIGGYHPQSPQIMQRRLEREHGRFCRTWSLTGRFGRLETRPDRALWQIETEGGNWSSSVQHILFRWDDVIERDMARGWIKRLALSALTFADFVINGALCRYFRHAWRYALFFLYPFVVLGLLAAVAAGGAHLALRATGIHPGWPVLLAVSVAGLWALATLFGARLKLDHLLDDWIYARAILRRPDSIVTGRLSQLADDLARERREILIVGHSFGAAFGAELIAMMVERHPDGAPIRFASLGASILKLGFNSAARRLRNAVGKIAGSPRVIWHDFTALNDLMNFYRVEPVKALGLDAPPAYSRKVRFRSMVAPAYYRSMQLNFFRLHNQFISGNDKRANFDFMMLMCGPWPMEVQSRSPDGAMPWVDPHGALTPTGLAQPLTGHPVQ